MHRLVQGHHDVGLDILTGDRKSPPTGPGRGTVPRVCPERIKAGLPPSTPAKNVLEEVTESGSLEMVFLA